MTPAADEVQRFAWDEYEGGWCDQHGETFSSLEVLVRATDHDRIVSALRQQLEQARVVLGLSRTALRIAEGAFMGVSDVFPAAGAMEHANRCGAAVDMIDALSEEGAK